MSTCTYRCIHALSLLTHNLLGEEENVHEQFIVTTVKEGPLTFLCNRSLPGVERNKRKVQFQLKFT